MSYKELAIQLINNMPDYKLGYAIAYLQGLVADESDDDLYCAGLLDEYKNDTEKMMLSALKRRQRCVESRRVAVPNSRR